MHAVRHDGRHPPGDIAFFRQKEIDSGVHDVQADYLFDQIGLQQQIAEADPEQEHGHCLAVVDK